VRLTAPSSKSMTQRALVIAALAEGPSTIVRPLVCDDSGYLTTLLRALGVAVEWRDGKAAVAPAPLASDGAPVFCGNAGTAVRFGACLSLVCGGPLVLDGDEHMQRRPLGPLAQSLAALGVTCAWLGRDGCVPLRLERTGALASEVMIDASLSSQYASGLLLVAPRLPHGLVLELTGAKVSQPYLDMTVAMMAQAGAQVERSGRRFRVPPGRYRRTPAIETDWSSAAFLLAAGRIAGVPIEVADLPAPGASLQGDSAFAAMLAELGQPRAHEFDLTDTPDLLAPLVAVALFASHPTRIRGAAHTRVKECDRIAVLCRELGRIGAQLHERPDGIALDPLVTPRAAPVTLDPEDDHRMAMAFGLVSLRVPAIEIADRNCVSKSFPEFWQRLARIRDIS